MGKVERDERGRLLPGSVANPRGRPPGVPNKVTREVREMVLQALDEEGGVDYLRWAARKQPVAFLALCGKLIPSEIRANLAGDGFTTLIIRDFTGREHEIDGPRNGAVGLEAGEVPAEVVDVTPEQEVPKPVSVRL